MFGRLGLGIFANKLTALTDNIIDISRFGAQINNHHYTKEDLVMRGGIIATTALSSYLAYNLNNPEETHCNSTTLGIAAGITGFLISHAITMYPIAKKRIAMRAECRQLIDEITSLSQELPIKAKKLEQFLNHILILTLADEKRANASQTWGFRKSLLITLKENLIRKDETLLDELKNEDVTTIVKNLTHGRRQLNLKIN